MRMNLSNHQQQNQFLGHQSLLSQSLSDLRSSPLNKNHGSPSGLSAAASSTPVRKKSSDCCNVNNNCDHESLLEVSGVTPRVASPDSMNTMTPTSSQGSAEDAASAAAAAAGAAEMSKLYEAINEQKDVIMKCLESDQCDIGPLNEQLEILQSMQQK